MLLPRDYPHGYAVEPRNEAAFRRQPKLSGAPTAAPSSPAHIKPPAPPDEAQLRWLEEVGRANQQVAEANAEITDLRDALVRSHEQYEQACDQRDLARREVTELRGKLLAAINDRREAQDQLAEALGKVQPARPRRLWPTLALALAVLAVAGWALTLWQLLHG